MKIVKSILKKTLSIREIGILVPTILLVVISQIVNPVFISFDNVMNIFRSTGFTLITAIGMTLVLIAGGLDLSVGSVLAVGGVVTSILVVNDVPILISIFVGIGVGCMIGFINGIIIVRFKIPPLIMTLGMLYMARGFVYIITKGTPIYPLPKDFQMIEQSSFLGIPFVLIIAAVLSIIGWFFLHNMTLGRSIYAVGGNVEAARFSGININKVNILVYVITSALAALTGILMASRLGSAQAGAGVNFELTVIASVIIGGTSTFGGSGTILGTVIEALFMNILSNSMTLMRIDVYWHNFVIGAILVLAVIIDQYNRQRLMNAK